MPDKSRVGSRNSPFQMYNGFRVDDPDHREPGSL
jgi:hypothetical protein